MKEEFARRSTVDSRKVATLVFDKIFPALQGEPISEMVFSCICAAAIAMKPDCPQEKLQEVLIATSGYLVNQLQDEVAFGDAN